MNLILFEIQSRLGVFCAFMNTVVYEKYIYCLGIYSYLKY